MNSHQPWHAKGNEDVNRVTLNLIQGLILRDSETYAE